MKHVIDNISFSARWVECACGFQYRASLMPDDATAWAQMNDAFQAHRRDVGLNRVSLSGIPTTGAGWRVKYSKANRKTKGVASA